MSRAARWTAVAVLVVAAVLAPFLVMDAWFAPTVERGLAAAGAEGVFVAVVALLSADVLLPVPSSVVGVAAGTTLGPWLGAAAVWLGLTTGCVVAYWLGARAASPLARRVLLSDADIARAAALADRFGPGTLVLARAVPVLAEASVVAAGMVGMPLARVLAVTALANLGVAAVLAWAGARAADHHGSAWAFAASVAIPAAAWLAARTARRFGGNRQYRLRAQRHR
ncbi:MAG: VTT domain-containing protein [Pseudomonadota bacterium]